MRARVVFDRRQGLVTVSRLSDNFHVVLEVNERTERTTDQGLVVDHNHVNHAVSFEARVLDPSIVHAAQSASPLNASRSSQVLPSLPQVTSPSEAARSRSPSSPVPPPREATEYFCE